MASCLRCGCGKTKSKLPHSATTFSEWLAIPFILITQMIAPISVNRIVRLCKIIAKKMYTFFFWSEWWLLLWFQFYGQKREINKNGMESKCQTKFANTLLAIKFTYFISIQWFLFTRIHRLKMIRLNRMRSERESLLFKLCIHFVTNWLNFMITHIILDNSDGKFHEFA